MAETTPNAAEHINQLIATHVKSTRADLEVLVKNILATAYKPEVEKSRADLYQKPAAAPSSTPATATPAATDPQLPDLSLIWPTIHGSPRGLDNRIFSPASTLIATTRFGPCTGDWLLSQSAITTSFRDTATTTRGSTRLSFSSVTRGQHRQRTTASLRSVLYGHGNP